ncbi:MAG: OadG family protein [Prevotella sp.]|nr:OadG family protein [Prevotella sp.]
MKRILLTLTVFLSTTFLFGQGALNIKINEVLTYNTASLQDEYGNHLPWIELVNTSYTTYNIRGMFITTNREVLNPKIPAPQRIAMMQIIPNGEPRTSIAARQHLLLFLNSNPAKGSLHFETPVKEGQPTWVALYDANGIDLIDSISVPAMAENKSYARVKDGDKRWDVKAVEAVTPGINNFVQINETKVTRLKRDDPHGFGITILSMGIVFTCLGLLYVFFTLLGKALAKNKKKAKRKSRFSEHPKVIVKHPDPEEVKRHMNKSQNEAIEIAVASLALEEENAVYVSVISLALEQYQNDVHDYESGIITIKPHNSRWHSEFTNINASK